MLELSDIFFGSHQKGKSITPPASETVRIYKKKPEKALSQAAFSKNQEISFLAPQANDKPLNKAICAKLSGFLYALK